MRVLGHPPSSQGPGTQAQTYSYSPMWIQLIAVCADTGLNTPMKVRLRISRWSFRVDMRQPRGWLWIGRSWDSRDDLIITVGPGYNQHPNPLVLRPTLDWLSYPIERCLWYKRYANASRFHLLQKSSQDKKPSITTRTLKMVFWGMGIWAIIGWVCKTVTKIHSPQFGRDPWCRHRVVGEGRLLPWIYLS